MVDYICGRSLPTSFQICPYTLGSLSDHCVLACALPLPSLMDPTSVVPEASTKAKYCWVTGDLGCEEGASAEHWAAHTNRDGFAAAIQGILSA